MPDFKLERTGRATANKAPELEKPHGRGPRPDVA